MGIAEDLILIILVGLITGLIASRVKIPPIIGYIIGGILIGPQTGIIGSANMHHIELLAEIGVALLLFSIGLDFSFKELKSVKSIALIGTPIQIVILAVFGMALGPYLGLTLVESIAFGMVISISSTMVVIKTLMSQGLTGTLSSRVMIGILIIQDLAAIPMMLIIPNLHSATENLLPMGWVLLKAFLVLGVIIIAGVRILPWVLRFIVKLHSRELFLISITAISLGIGYLTHMFGLSLAFGAFVAGMVVSESEYSHQALNDIIPLRDIFGLVFFTSIGMMIDINFISGHITQVVVLVVVILIAKFIVFSVLSMSFKYHNIIPLAVGLGLSQIGEFSFVLARTALKSEIIDQNLYSLILSVSVITMIVTPFSSLLAAPLYSLKKKWFKHEQVQTINLPASALQGHIIIAGGGRVGHQLALTLKQINRPFVIIEQSFQQFEKNRSEELPVIYGDSTQEPVLEAAKVHRAKIVIITIPFLSAAKEIIEFTQRHNKKAKIIARAYDVSHAYELTQTNIYEVVQPEFEASLEIVRQSLTLLEMDEEKINSITHDMREKAFRTQDALATE